MAQAPYPPPAAPSVDDLEATALSTTEDIHHAPYLLAFIASRQRGTPGTLLSAVSHLAAALLQSYTEEGTPVRIGPPWLREALENAIQNGPHASACTQETIGFIQGNMQRRVNDGFSILLPAADAVQIFGEKLKLYHILAVS